MKDPAFLAAAKRLRLEIVPSTGEEIEAAVLNILTTPKDIVEATKAVLAESPR